MYLPELTVEMQPKKRVRLHSRIIDHVTDSQDASTQGRLVIGEQPWMCLDRIWTNKNKLRFVANRRGDDAWIEQNHSRFGYGDTLRLPREHF